MDDTSEVAREIEEAICLLPHAIQQNMTGNRPDLNSGSESDSDAEESPEASNSKNEGEEEGNDDPESLQSLPSDMKWGMAISKKAWETWSNIDKWLRRKVFESLCHLGKGEWGCISTIRKLSFKEKVYSSLDAWIIKIGGKCGILLEVCIDYHAAKQAWMDVIHIWAIPVTDKKYKAGVEEIKRCHKQSAAYRNDLNPIPVEKKKFTKSHKSPGVYQVRGEKVNEGIQDFPAANSAEKKSIKFYRVNNLLMNAVMRGIRKGIEIEFPIEMSLEEELIAMDTTGKESSVILVSRSGTGKSTCMLYRIWALWRINYECEVEHSHHILFITASATLKEQLYKSFKRLRNAVVTAGERVETSKKPKWEEDGYLNLSGMSTSDFPVFLTSRQYIQMLDATMEDPFLPRIDGGKLMYGDGHDEFDLDGMGNYVDFQRSYHEGDDRNKGKEEGEGSCKRKKDKVECPMKQMTYQVFEDVIWPKICKKQSRGLKASQVYLEINSYIKGSAEALQSSEKYLTHDEYLKVGRKRAPNFTQELRSQVYEIFLKYEKEKRRARMYDSTDLVKDIYDRMKDYGYQGTKIKYIFRDEVQDSTQGELLLDFRVISNAHGIFYAGDSCQTIARGVGFRFEDIRTLFYEEQARGLDKFRKPKVPRLTSLSTNFRNHRGITNVSGALVALLEEYFPIYIDKLPRERGLVDGRKPHLMTTSCEGDILKVLTGSLPNDPQVAFGPDKVVLVRTMASMDGLPRELTEGLFHLTIPQAKGLEFDDVLILNFFKDSPANKEWSLLKESGCNQGEWDGRIMEEHCRSSNGPQLQDFDPHRDILLCEELKHLYTAVTRCKRNLVFFDSDMRKRRPFFDFLLSKQLATSCEHGQNVLCKWRKDPKGYDKAWFRRGQDFLNRKDYHVARECFLREKNDIWAAVATSQICIQDARRRGGKDREAKRLFFEAGYKLLLAAAKVDSGEVHVKQGEVKGWVGMACAAFKHAEKFLYAGSVYARIDMAEEAKKTFLQGGHYDRAAKICEEQKWWVEECMLHTDRNNPRRNFPRAFHLILNTPGVASKIDVATKNRVAKEMLASAWVKGLESDRKHLHDICMMMEHEELYATLSHVGEWKVLGQELLERVKGANILAGMKEFPHAVMTMQGACTTDSQRKLFWEYALMAQANELLKKVRGLKKYSSVRRKLLLTESLMLAEGESLAGRPLDEVKSNLRHTWEYFMEHSKPLGQFEALYWMMKIDLQGFQSMLLTHKQSTLVPLEAFNSIMKMLKSLRTWFVFHSGLKKDDELACIEEHYEVDGLSKRKDVVSFRGTNKRVDRALQNINAAASRVKLFEPSVEMCIPASVCKKALAWDICSQLSAILLEILGFRIQQIETCGQNGKGEDSKDIHQRHGHTRTSPAHLQELFLEGAEIITLLRKISTQMEDGEDRMNILNHGTCKKFLELIRTELWKEDGVTFNILQDPAYAACADRIWEPSSYKYAITAFGPLPMDPYFWCSNLKRAHDPNFSYWMLHAACMLHEPGSFEAVNWFAHSTYLLTKQCYKQHTMVFGEIKSCMCKFVEGERLLGHYLVAAMKELVYFHRPMSAIERLTVFTDACELDLPGCSRQERPQLCVEALVQVLEWKTLLLLSQIFNIVFIPQQVILSLEEIWGPGNTEKILFECSEGTTGSQQEMMYDIIWDMQHLVEVLGSDLRRGLSMDDEEFSTGPAAAMKSIIRDLTKEGDSREDSMKKLMEIESWNADDLMQALWTLGSNLDIGVAMLTEEGMENLRIYGGFHEFTEKQEAMADNHNRFSSWDDGFQVRASMRKRGALIPTVECREPFVCQTKGRMIASYVLLHARKHVQNSKTQRAVRLMPGWIIKALRVSAEEAQLNISLKPAFSEVHHRHEDGFMQFGNSSNRLKWMEYSLAYQNNICIVCPGLQDRYCVDEHFRSDDHLLNRTSCQGYIKVQKDISNFFRDFENYQRKMGRLKKSANGNRMIFLHLLINPFKAEVDRIVNLIHQVEETREWSQGHKIKNIVRRQEKALKACIEKLERLEQDIFYGVYYSRHSDSDSSDDLYAS